MVSSPRVQSKLAGVLDVWCTLYDTAVLNISLVASDPNHCAHLVSAELYSAYGRLAKMEVVSKETKTQMRKFDLYQNSIASAACCIVGRIKWAAIGSGGAEDKARCVKKLLSLLAWQLARFWDGMKKVCFGGGIEVHGVLVLILPGQQQATTEKAITAN